MEANLLEKVPFPDDSMTFAGDAADLVTDAILLIGRTKAIVPFDTDKLIPLGAISNVSRALKERNRIGIRLLFVLWNRH